MKVSLVIITDGRLEYLEKTLGSLASEVQYPFLEKIIVNDCMDVSFKKSVNGLAAFYGLTVIHHEEKRGFAGAYNTAWNSVSPESEYIFNCEDDFTFNEPIDIGKMIFILNWNRNIVQCVLKRQPWGEEEKKHGGFVEQWPELYEEKKFVDIKWTEHNLFYSTNPGLTPRFVFEKGWPMIPKSEEEFSKELFRNPNLKACFYGGKFEPPKTTHIGFQRAGSGY